jgi:spermidine synthase
MSFLAKLKSTHSAIYWSIASGMAALIYQVVLQKLFTYVLGYALLSTTIVIAAYMLGLALGGFLAGLFCDRLTRSACLAVYSLLEAGIGIFGLGSLFGYKAYLARLTSLLASPGFLHLMSSVAFRSALAMAVLLPMTVLMGATLPLLALGVDAGAGRHDKSASVRAPTVNALYSANLLGGLAGIILSAYLVMPSLGLWGAAILACLANFSIAVLVLRFRSSTQPRHSTVKSPESLLASGGGQTPPRERLSWVTACFLSFASGLVLFALEIVWTHLLAAVIGLTVYAFADMLIAVFIGLYIGADREAHPDSDSRPPLSALVLLSGLFLALSVPFYAWSPLLFSALGLLSPGFIIRQVALVAVGCFLIVPVAMLLSRIFPRVLAAGVPPERRGRGVGFLLSINTFGCLLGLFLGNFVLIPVFGSQITLKGLAVFLALIAWIVSLRGGKGSVTILRRFPKLGVVAAILALVVVIVPCWPPRLLLSGRSIYFHLSSETNYKPLDYMAEDAEGGFVTVSGPPDGTMELRTNGKFLGNNTGEMQAQYAFGYLPALAASHTGKAFVIGCGTGVTTRALTDAGFSHVTLAEISRPVLFAARNYFRSVNGGVLDDPRVTVIHDDGRNALTLSGDQYDVISIELTNIWFAGAANLYSTDFYSTVHQKLAPGGVLEQWIQLHHMRLVDIYVLLNTVHQRFKHVAVWYGGEQGEILASDEPLTLDWQRMRSIAASDNAVPFISLEDLYGIPYGVLLDESEVQLLTDPGRLAFVVGHPTGLGRFPAINSIYMSRFVDTDFYPYLEYATPLGNIVELAEYANPNKLAEIVGPTAAIPFRNVPDSDLPLAKALLAYQNGSCDELHRLVDSGAVSLGKDSSQSFTACTPKYVLRLQNAR